MEPNNIKRGMYLDQQFLVSEAASALAHLAEGRVDQRSQHPIQIGTPSPLCAVSRDRQKKSHVHELGRQNPESISLLIKETVLHHLRRPEDSTKRNMFAVEGKSIKFPVKLMFLLDECQEFNHIISWTEDGLSFIIHDAMAFEDEVLPVIFKEARFSSFLRKLTRWGFLKKSKPCGMVFHQMKFRRGHYSLCIDISCANKAGEIVRASTTTTGDEYTTKSTLSDSHESKLKTDATSTYSKLPTDNGNVAGSIMKEEQKEASTSPTTITSTGNLKTNTIRALPHPTPSDMSRLHNQTKDFTRYSDKDQADPGWLHPSTTPSLLNEIRRANELEEEEIRLLKEYLSSKSRSTLRPPFENISLNRPQYDYRHAIQQEQLQMLENRAIGEVQGNVTPHEDVLLSSLLQRTPQANQQQLGRGVNSFLDQRKLSSGMSNNIPPHQLLQQQQQQQQQGTGRIHSQVMSAALKGLLSSQQNDTYRTDHHSAMNNIDMISRMNKYRRVSYPQQPQPDGNFLHSGRTHSMHNTCDPHMAQNFHNASNDLLLRKEYEKRMRHLPPPSEESMQQQRQYQNHPQHQHQHIPLMSSHTLNSHPRDAPMSAMPNSSRKRNLSQTDIIMGMMRRS